MVKEFKWITEEIQKKIPINHGISNMSKTIKKLNNDFHIKREGVEYSDIWGVRPILDTIVSYVDNRSLAQFNAISKKMHQLTNSIIHNNLKLFRDWDIVKKAHKGLTPAARREAEISDCIQNNSKYSHFVKEFTLNTYMKSTKYIEFFNTFKHLTKLTMHGVYLTQGQFICILKPLTQLQELHIGNFFGITEGNKNLIKKGVYKLPYSLTKLSLDGLYTYYSPDSFIQFINSHTNLEEFKFNGYRFTDILGPLQKNYPSLKVFEYNNEKLENYEDLLNVIKFNPQLFSLSLGSECLNETIINHINQYLVNLEELHLRKFKLYDQSNSALILRFSRPTMIKKLKLVCEDLSEASLLSVLVNCPHLKEFEVDLPLEWKFWGNIISRNCRNLEKLTFTIPRDNYGDDKVKFSKDFYNSEFFTNNNFISDTVTHLTLNEFEFKSSKAEHFKTFKKLKFIKFSWSYASNFDRDEYTMKEDIWPNYKMKKSGMYPISSLELSKY